MIVILYPLVLLARVVTRTVSREGFGIHVSREEIGAMASLGVDHGVMEHSESRIVKAVLRFASLRVFDVMTPSTVVFSLRLDTKVGEVVARDDWLRFSRIPLYEGGRDRVTSYVLIRDILLHAARDRLETPLGELAREIPVAHETEHLPKVFDRLLQGKSQIALVVDEYGAMAGLVTTEDVVETLLDLEIVDEIDAVEDMQEFARAQWRKRARELGIIDGEEPGPAGGP